MEFKPRPYQEIGYDHIMQYDRSALFLPMGMGKTSTTLYALSNLGLLENNKTLVLAPLRVAKSVWPAECQKWDNFNHFKIRAICGSPSERAAALKCDADIHTVNYENIPWLVEQFGDKWPWTTVIADESTRLKSFRLRQGSKRAQALSKVAWSKVRRFIALTGTPSPNGLQDLWGQMWFLDQGQRLGKSYAAFMQRWFRPKYFGSYEMIPLPNAQAEIQDKIKDICLSLNVNDWFNIDEPVIIDVPVVLPPHARALYKQMEKTMFIELSTGEADAVNAAAKSIKCLQLANGAVYLNDIKENADTTNRLWEAVHDVKLDALDSIIEEAAGAPVLVAYHFKSDLARLKKRFPQGKQLDANPSTIDQWNRGEISVLFTHPASAGHGLNLQDGGNIVVFFGHNWNLEEYQQILERIGPVRQMQAGHPRPVYIYNIRAVDTIDDLVIMSRTTKRTVQDLLMEAARRR